MKKIIIFAMLLLCAAAAAAYYFYNRISYQPDWYAGGKTGRQYILTYDVDDLERKIIADLKKGKNVGISADQIVPLIANRLEKQTGLEIQKAIKAVRSTIKSDEIEMEMIVDVREMASENLPGDAQKALEQLLKIVPENALSDLYVKCDLQFVKQKDFVSLEPVSGISVGKMNLPLAELEDKFGSNRKISLKKFPISDFELKENSIVLKPKTAKKRAP